MKTPTEKEALDRFRRIGAFIVDRLKIHAPRLPVSDDDVSYLLATPGLQQLVLTETDITDQSMPIIGSMRDLTLLDLSNNAISDIGARHLASLIELETLGIYGTQITDAAVESIASLPKLTMLNISYTSVTDVGLLKLVRPWGFHTIETQHSNITTSGIQEFVRHCPTTMLVTDKGVVSGEKE